MRMMDGKGKELIKIKKEIYVWGGTDELIFKLLESLIYDFLKELGERYPDSGLSTITLQKRK